MKAAMFLIALLFLSFRAHADALNLSLPPLEIDPDYCKKYQCDFEKQNLLPQFKFKDTDLRKEKAVFYALNVIDIWSSNRAIRAGYGKEKNPLLPSYPSLAQLVTHKAVLISAYEYAQFLDNRTIIITMNYGLAAVVANNIEVIIDNESR